MPEKRILIYSISKDEEFKMTKSYIDSLSLFDIKIDYIQIKNNKTSICEKYNNVLNNIRNDIKENDKTSLNSYDFIIFCHSDVFLNVNQLINHLYECNEKYDVFGLAGCEKISIGKSPLNWFTGSIGYEKTRWGMVFHGEDNSKTFFSSHTPNVFDHHVACIDGLCIIFGKNAINSNLLFDERFKFDFYDTDLSFECIINKHLKLGVLVEPSLYHYSVGKSITTKEFLVSEAIFREKWGFTNG